MTTEKPQTKEFFENGFVIFFLGPILFLLITLIAGNSIFYDKQAKNEKRFVWLLSSGALFYLVLIITLVAIN